MTTTLEDPRDTAAGRGGPPAPARRAHRGLVAAGVAGGLLLAATGATGAVLAGRALDDLGDAARAAVAGPADGSGLAAPAPDAEPLTTDAVDWAAVADVVRPSVVAIDVATPQGQGQGSGIVIDGDGHVVTNNHVVAGAEQGGAVQVRLADGRVLDAEVTGLDPSTDLAVIEVQDAPDDLVPAVFGSSGGVEVGEPVMAVGNPLGLAGTFTTGIVSAVDRPVTAGGTSSSSPPVVTAAVQTDAAVNPGNSGGALVDAAGQVVGVNSSIATLGGRGAQSGSIGLGFAIPADEVRGVAAQLIEDGTADHARMGVSVADAVVAAPGGDRGAAGVDEVVPGSPAEEAGLRPGDAVVAVDGRPVTEALAMTAIVRSYQPGETVTVTVVRDGEEEEVDVTLAVADERTA